MEVINKQWKNVALRNWIYQELERLALKDGRSLTNYLEHHLVSNLKLKKESGYKAMAGQVKHNCSLQKP